MKNTVMGNTPHNGKWHYTLKTNFIYMHRVFLVAWTGIEPVTFRLIRWDYIVIGTITTTTSCDCSAGELPRNLKMKGTLVLIFLHQCAFLYNFLLNFLFSHPVACLTLIAPNVKEARVVNIPTFRAF